MSQVDPQDRYVPLRHEPGPRQQGPVSSEGDEEVDAIVEEAFDPVHGRPARDQGLLECHLDAVDLENPIQGLQDRTDPRIVYLPDNPDPAESWGIPAGS
jgi:hypothetical protein